MFSDYDDIPVQTWDPPEVSMCHQPCEDHSTKRPTICIKNLTQQASDQTTSQDNEGGGSFGRSNHDDFTASGYHHGNQTLVAMEQGASGSTSSGAVASKVFHSSARTRDFCHLPLLLAQLVLLWYYRTILYQSLYRVIGFT